MATGAFRQFMSDPMRRAIGLGVFSGAVGVVEQVYVPSVPPRHLALTFGTHSLVSVGVLGIYHAFSKNLMSIPVWVGMETAGAAWTIYSGKRGWW
jgi:hypothetical protein